MRARVDSLSNELVRLSESLNAIKEITLVGKQCGNFVLFRSEYNSQLMQYLVNNNVLIRDQSKQLMLDKCLRISIGTSEQNNQLLSLIQTFFAPQAVSPAANNEAV